MRADVMRNYGFTRSFDRAGLYETPPQRTMLESIKGAILAGRSATVCGVVGSGKTFLCSYPLNLPESLKHEAQLRAKRDGVSLNQWIATAVAEKVGSMKAADFFSERAAVGDPSGKRLLDVLHNAPDLVPDAGDEPSI